MTDKPRKDPLRYYWWAVSFLGLVLLAVDANMSRKFGATFDDTAMVGLTALSIGSGILLILVISMYRGGNVLFAKGLGVAWALCFAFNIISNMGVATSVRLAETQTSNIQKANHQERAKATKEAEAQLKWAEGQLKALITKNGWAATVTAEGLRQQVADLRVARASESKLGGCGPKCRGIENQITEIQGRIAVAEQRQNLDKQIAATKKVLNQARTTLSKSDGGVSLVANQAALYSRWTVGWFGDGESVSVVQNSNELLGIFMAAVIAVASCALTLAGVWPHLMAITPASSSAYGARSWSSNGGGEKPGFLSPSMMRTNSSPEVRTVYKKDTALAAAIRDAIAPLHNDRAAA